MRSRALPMKSASAQSCGRWMGHWRPFPAHPSPPFALATIASTWMTCPVRQVMVETRNAIANVLDNLTLAEMRARSDPRDLAPMYHI